MLKSLLPLVAVSIALISGGCSKSESPVSSTDDSIAPSAQLLGYWKVQSVTLDGVETPLVEALHRQGPTVTELLIIDPSGKYYVGDFDLYRGEIYRETGTFMVEGQQLTFTANTETNPTISPISGHWTMDTNTLTLVTKASGKAEAIHYVSANPHDWAYVW